MPLLLALANFAPLLIKYIGAGDATQKIVEAVSVVATTITGAKTPEEALKNLQESTEIAQKFQLAILEKSQQLDEIFLKDIQNARNRDIEIRKTGQRNTRAETMYVLAVVMIVILVYLVWSDTSLSEYVKGVVTLVLGRFLGYLDSIYNFEFGTTRTAQEKDQTIQHLAKNGGK